VRVTWCIHVNTLCTLDTSHSYVCVAYAWYGASICVCCLCMTWRIYKCTWRTRDMAHPSVYTAYVWHDAFIRVRCVHVTRRIHVCILRMYDMTHSYVYAAYTWHGASVTLWISDVTTHWYMWIIVSRWEYVMWLFIHTCESQTHSAVCFRWSRWRWSIVYYAIVSLHPSSTSRYTYVYMIVSWMIT